MTAPPLVGCVVWSQETLMSFSALDKYKRSTKQRKNKLYIYIYMLLWISKRHLIVSREMDFEEDRCGLSAQL